MRNPSPKTLNDACEFIVDCLHATAPTQDSGYPLIRTPNIGRGRLLLDGVFRVSEDTYTEWTRRAVPQANDLILAREAPAGNVAIVKNGQAVCLGQRTVHLRPRQQEIDPDFLCYYLLHPRQQGALLAGETGATAKHVNMRDIRRLPLGRLPRLEVQRVLGRTLAAYDDLIENNRRRIALLEEAARLLYHEWFVRLRFPGHERDRIAEGMLPGWARKRLSSVAEVNRLTLPSNYEGIIEYIDIASVMPGQISSTTRYDFRDAPSRARRVVKHGDILWSCVRPNRRSYAIIWSPPENLIASTGFAVITPNGAPSTYLYFALSTDEFVAYLTNHARGAAYPAVLASDFERAEVVVPPKPLLDAFDECAVPIFSQLHVLRKQSEKAIAARDLLLPRLMSGELTVGES